MMKKIAGIMALPIMAAILLFMAMSSCSGSFIDPGMADMGGNGTGGGFGGGGTGNGSTNNNKVVYYNKTKKELYFRADRWENVTFAASGSDWNTGNGLVLSDFFSGTLKKNAVYTVQISGNLDTSLSYLTVMFQNTSNSDWVMVNDWITPVYVSSGPINRSFSITFADFTGTFPDPKKIAVEFSNQVRVSDNVSNKELMATISNFSMTIKENSSTNSGGNSNTNWGAWNSTQTDGYVSTSHVSITLTSDDTGCYVSVTGTANPDYYNWASQVGYDYTATVGKSYKVTWKWAANNKPFNNVSIRYASPYNHLEDYIYLSTAFTIPVLEKTEEYEFTMPSNCEGGFTFFVGGDIGSFTIRDFKIEEKSGGAIWNEDYTVTITGVPKVGAKITATSSGSGFLGNFEWFYADENVYSQENNFSIEIYGIYDGISGTNDSVLTIPANLVGKYIMASRGHSSLGSGGGYSSNFLGPVQRN